jgi:flagellar biosynthesis protein FlhF
MSVKRFVGASARECLRRVKDEMGPDAVVISNKPLGNGVEVVAMTPDSLDAISQQAAARPVAPGALRPCARGKEARHARR